MRSLRRLSLSRCTGARLDTDAHAFGSALRPLAPQLVRLDISGARISPRSLVVLAPLLSSLSVLNAACLLPLLPSDGSPFPPPLPPAAAAALAPTGWPCRMLHTLALGRAAAAVLCRVLATLSTHGALVSADVSTHNSTCHARVPAAAAAAVSVMVDALAAPLAGGAGVFPLPTHAQAVASLSSFVAASPALRSLVLDGHGLTLAEAASLASRSPSAPSLKIIARDPDDSPLSDDPPPPGPHALWRDFTAFLFTEIRGRHGIGSSVGLRALLGASSGAVWFVGGFDATSWLFLAVERVPRVSCACGRARSSNGAWRAAAPLKLIRISAAASTAARNEACSWREDARDVDTVSASVVREVAASFGDGSGGARGGGGGGIGGGGSGLRGALAARTFFSTYVTQTTGFPNHESLTCDRSCFETLEKEELRDADAGGGGGGDDEDEEDADAPSWVDREYYSTHPRDFWREGSFNSPRRAGEPHPAERRLLAFASACARRASEQPPPGSPHGSGDACFVDRVCTVAPPGVPFKGFVGSEARGVEVDGLVTRQPLPTGMRAGGLCEAWARAGLLY